MALSIAADQLVCAAHLRVLSGQRADRLHDWCGWLRPPITSIRFVTPIASGRARAVTGPARSVPDVKHPEGRPARDPRMWTPADPCRVACPTGPSFWPVTPFADHPLAVFKCGRQPEVVPPLSIASQGPPRHGSGESRTCRVGGHRDLPADGRPGACLVGSTAWGMRPVDQRRAGHRGHPRRRAQRCSMESTSATGATAAPTTPTSRGCMSS